MADLQQLCQQALRLLSRREYSEYQLIQKLRQHSTESQLIAEAIAWCKQHNYLDQRRFVTMLVRHRSAGGYGLNYIMQECRQQQIDSQLVMASVNELELDWFELAQAAYRKKYQQKPLADYQDKLKRMAYLQRRGFSSEQINYAVTQQD